MPLWWPLLRVKWSAGIVYQVDALKAVIARSGAFWGVLLLNGPRVHVRGRRSFQNVAPVKVRVTTQRGRRSLIVFQIVAGSVGCWCWVLGDDR